jgi:polyisoprenoid-binding protein YceI
MKKIILLIALTATTTIGLYAQKKTTTSATVTFDATTPKDALPKAENKTGIASVDTKTGVVAFEAAVKNFSFSNPKMQEHFNGANWMNSDQYPKFSFTGTIEKVSKVKFDKNGTYTAKVKGNLKIKDISKPVTVNVVFIVTNGKIKATTNFTVALADYGISGQPVEAGKVSPNPKVTVSAEF